MEKRIYLFLYGGNKVYLKKKMIGLGNISIFHTFTFVDIFLSAERSSLNRIKIF